MFSVGLRTEAMGNSLDEMRLEISATQEYLEEVMQQYPGNPDVLRQLKALHKLAADVNAAMDQHDATKQQYEALDPDSLMDHCEEGPSVSAEPDCTVVYCGSRAISDAVKIVNSHTILHDV